MLSLFFVLLSGLLAAASRRLARQIPQADARTAQLWQQQKHYDKTPLDLRVLAVVCGLGAAGCLIYAALLGLKVVIAPT